MGYPSALVMGMLGGRSTVPGRCPVKQCEEWGMTGPKIFRGPGNSTSYGLDSASVRPSQARAWAQIRFTVRGEIR
jgi:hypothetical protein